MRQQRRVDKTVTYRSQRQIPRQQAKYRTKIGILAFLALLFLVSNPMSMQLGRSLYQTRPRGDAPIGTTIAASNSTQAGIVEMAESYYKPMVDYFKTTLTKFELSSMARTINVKAIGKNIVPTPANFRQYLRDSMTASRDPSLDMWDMPYIFERKGKKGTIISFGPDKKRGTPDDIRLDFDLP